MPGIIFVTGVPVEWAIVLFSLAFFGQQSWSTLVMIVPTDLFERRVVASVAGLVGFGGAMGGLVMNLIGRPPARSRIRLRDGVLDRRHPARHRVRRDHADHSQNSTRGEDFVKITDIRTRVVEWRGPTVPPEPHFCTNPMDLLSLPADSMGGFRFHGWVVVEIFTDAGPRRHRQRRAVAAADEAVHRRLPEAASHRPGSVRHRVPLAAHVSQDDGVWAEGRGDGGDQRRGHRDVGHPREGDEPAGVQAARRAHEAEDSGLRQPPLQPAARRARRRNAEVLRRGLSRDEDALRLGTRPTAPPACSTTSIWCGPIREVVGDGVDIMADAYMGWNLDYARRMIPLLEPFHLRWLEEPVIPDDLQGYVALKAMGRIPIAGGEHGFTQYEFRDMLEARAVDYIQFDTNRVGGITQARKISAMAESFGVPVVPHAGQMHNYHIVMASLNSPMAEFFPPVDVEVGNELFWYIFDGEPTPLNGDIDLRDDVPGLGLTIKEDALDRFSIIE